MQQYYIFSAAHVYRKYSAREHVETFNTQHEVLAEYCMILETPSQVLYFSYTQASVLSVILYFLIAWLGEIFCSTQTAEILVIMISVSV